MLAAGINGPILPPARVAVNQQLPLCDVQYPVFADTGASVQTGFHRRAKGDCAVGDLNCQSYVGRLRVALLIFRKTARQHNEIRLWLAGCVVPRRHVVIGVSCCTNKGPKTSVSQMISRDRPEK